MDHGYIEAAEKLQSESRISLQVLPSRFSALCSASCLWPRESRVVFVQEHDAADNVDLLAIIQVSRRI